MPDALRTSMTSEEFVAWADRQDVPWEFDGLRPVAMNGGTVAHDVIQGNVKDVLRVRLRGSQCRAFGPHMRVATGGGRYRYPDGVVTCSPVLNTTKELSDPVIIFEVLSDGTERIDRTVKLVEYRSIPSLRRYIMLEQDQVAVTTITRMDGVWAIDVLRDGDTLALPEIGIDIPVAEFYLDVDLPPPPE